MSKSKQKSHFQTKLLRPAKSDSNMPWAFVVLPKNVSALLPRRGRTTVNATLNGHSFRATLEPDGQLSHWLKINNELLQTTGTEIGDVVKFEVSPVEKEPEPEIPADLKTALATCPDALAVWEETTTIARLDWIHWVTTAKQAKTRATRISNACDMLASGKKRVCCFDPSGYYSKAFCAPKIAD